MFAGVVVLVVVFLSYLDKCFRVVGFVLTFCQQADIVLGGICLAKSRRFFFYIKVREREKKMYANPSFE